jgi:large subunit ribosomal protein L1
MSEHGKKYKNSLETIDRLKPYSIDEALSKVKELAFAKFDETVRVDVNLGIDPTKGEQVVRGSVVLPNKFGKDVRILVFAKGDQAQEAKDAGADYVGDEDLVAKILSGWMEFDYAVATPDLMGIVGKVARILGPRGLLPNKKLGTVALEVGPVIKELKQGKLFFRNDKSGLVHFSFGKVSFEPTALKENLLKFIKALAASKPASSKGRFIKKVTVSSAMGVGVPVNLEELLA